VNFETLQEQIGREIQGYLDSIEGRERQKQEENRKLETRKEELKKELDNLIALAAKGGLTAEVLQAAIEERQTEINGIELKVQMNTSAVDFLKVNLENNSELNFYHGPQEHIEYGLLLMEQKKELVKLLIEKITLHSDGAYEIEWSL
jgi:predicted RNase H-like nuclease (RuvC/YqgF family)